MCETTRDRLPQRSRYRGTCLGTLLVGSSKCGCQQHSETARPKYVCTNTHNTLHIQYLRSAPALLFVEREPCLRKQQPQPLFPVPRRPHYQIFLGPLCWLSCEDAALWTLPAAHMGAEMLRVCKGLLTVLRISSPLRNLGCTRGFHVQAARLSQARWGQVAGILPREHQ
jgi:hypothetical protein